MITSDSKQVVVGKWGTRKETNGISGLTSKRDDVERLNRYAIRERLRAGLNMNKIHLAHFSHR